MKPDENSVDNSELLHKMITRTDSYLNYANTKSTIIITFITALIAFVGAHAGNAIHYLNERNYPELIIIFKILLLINAAMLIIGFYHAGKSVMPYTRPSSKKNIFSFIDIIHHYPDEITYTHNIMSMDKETVKSVKQNTGPDARAHDATSPVTRIKEMLYYNGAWHADVSESTRYNGLHHMKLTVLDEKK